MHKQLNQEIQNLKEELEKREQEIFKFKSSLNTTVIPTSSNNIIGVSSGQNHHHHHHHHSSSSHSHIFAAGLQTVGNLITNLQNNIHGSPMSSTANLSNFNLTSASNHHLDDTIEFQQDNQDRLESWLSIPNKRNIKKYGWKKLYVVLRKGKLFFYNSLKDHQSQEPYMTIDLE
jgi:hypothetical protein